MEKQEQEAWTQWFEKCAISRCDQENQELLKRNIKRTFLKKIKHIGRSSEDLPSNALTFFDSWFCQRKKGDSTAEIKPYKQFIIDRAIRNNDSLEKTVYAYILGKDLYTVLRKMIEDEEGHCDKRLVNVDTNLPLGHHPPKIPLLREELIWVVKKVAGTFLSLSQNPRQDYDRLSTYLDTQQNYQNAGISKSSFYEQRKKAEKTMFDAICADNETKIFCLSYGTEIIPMILNVIKKHLQENDDEE